MEQDPEAVQVGQEMGEDRAKAELLEPVLEKRRVENKGIVNSSFLVKQIPRR